MSNFSNEYEFVNFLREARDPMDKNCLAGRFLYHYIHEPHVYQLFEKFTLNLLPKKINHQLGWLQTVCVGKLNSLLKNNIRSQMIILAYMQGCLWLDTLSMIIFSP